jgi:hypothetical protein
MKSRNERRYGMEQKHPPTKPPIDVIALTICLIGFVITMAVILGEYM